MPTPMKIVNGEYIPLTDDEIAEKEARRVAADEDMSMVRADRNGLLAGSDWTQLADAPIDATTWATYRQELRDLPAAFDRVSDVVWPTPPA